MAVEKFSGDLNKLVLFRCGDMLNFLRNLFCGKFKKKIIEISQDNYLLREELSKLFLEKETLNDELKTFTLPHVPSPQWLDDSKQAYSPPVRYLSTTGKPYTTSLKQQDIYTPSKVLDDLVTSEGWRRLSHNKRLKEIWYFVIDRLKYAYDFGDAWQYPQTTYYRRWGDCEDGTVLFITLCKIAGIPADSVFNACGYFDDGNNKFGHSYPVAQMEDGLWYVFETTINNKPKHPIRWKDSPYYAEWGLANHIYQGKLKDGKKQI